MPGAIPLWAPIYPMSAHQLDLLDKCLREMLHQGKISEKQITSRSTNFICAKTRWINETVCRLLTTKQAHHRKQISTTIDDRTKRSGCSRENFDQVGPQG